VALDSGFPIVGCEESRPSGLPVVRMDRCARAEVMKRGGAGARVIARRDGPAGTWKTRVRGDPERGWVLTGTGFGAFHATPEGAAVSCAPVSVAPWRWQRYLVGQVLPFVATLRGLEPFHAAAVTVGGAALALFGGSGAGKSSIAAELVLAGAGFVADDVVAVGVRDDGGVIAYPGTGLISLRRPTIEQAGPSRLEQLGVRIGADASGARVAVARDPAPSPLQAVYVLDPGEPPGTLTPSGRAEPRLLLGSTFNAALQTPERLARQLDVCARIARSARVVSVGVRPGSEWSALAGLILDDAQRDR
jgi:hypothetical protein